MDKCHYSHVLHSGLGLQCPSRPRSSTQAHGEAFWPEHVDQHSQCVHDASVRLESPWWRHHHRPNDGGKRPLLDGKCSREYGLHAAASKSTRAGQERGPHRRSALLGGDSRRRGGRLANRGRRTLELRSKAAQDHVGNSATLGWQREPRLTTLPGERQWSLT
jgi:hypothetical protein